VPELPAAPSEVDPGDRARQVADAGSTILQQVVDEELVGRIRGSIERIEQQDGVGPGRGRFEGRRTVRVYNLLAKDVVFGDAVLHPAVLEVVERVLDVGCLVSSVSSICIGPGEAEQPIHVDDQSIRIPRPHQALVCTAIWALDDFTADNGATRFVPYSHRRADAPDFAAGASDVAGVEVEQAIMPRGSVLLYDGALWHGGGANGTDCDRRALAVSYCAGFLRQQENLQLGIPLEVARSFPSRLRQLCGYGIYDGMIGHIDKQRPANLLLGPAPDEQPGEEILWEDRIEPWP
jgi:ectoine hydroxylase-related dioxygenase (phytanoyl-CoA dioxygenase family)